MPWRTASGFMIKWELEDLAFRYLQPDDYYLLADKLAKKARAKTLLIASWASYRSALRR